MAYILRTSSSYSFCSLDVCAFFGNLIKHTGVLPEQPTPTAAYPPLLPPLRYYVDHAPKGYKPSVVLSARFFTRTTCGCTVQSSYPSGVYAPYATLTTLA